MTRLTWGQRSEFFPCSGVGHATQCLYRTRGDGCGKGASAPTSTFVPSPALRHPWCGGFKRDVNPSFSWVWVYLYLPGGRWRSTHRRTVDRPTSRTCCDACAAAAGGRAPAPAGNTRSTDPSARSSRTPPRQPAARYNAAVFLGTTDRPSLPSWLTSGRVRAFRLSGQYGVSLSTVRHTAVIPSALAGAAATR